MKRLLLGLFVFMLLLTGCGGKDSNDLHEGNSSDNLQNNENQETNNVKVGKKFEWKSDVPLSDIKQIKTNDMMLVQKKLFITKSGDLYEFSTNKIYSNEQVTKKVDVDKKFDQIYLYGNDRNLSLLISDDGQYYEIPMEDNIYELFKYPHLNASKQVNSKYSYSFGAYEGGFESYYLYYYVKNNSVYADKYITNYDVVIQGHVDKVTEGLFIDSLPEGETFVSIEGDIIITDKAFYEIGIKNQKEYENYEDVEPIKGLVKIKNVSEQYDNIAYFNGNYIIYKDDNHNIYLYE